MINNPKKRFFLVFFLFLIQFGLKAQTASTIYTFDPKVYPSTPFNLVKSNNGDFYFIMNNEIMKLSSGGILTPFVNNIYPYNLAIDSLNNIYWFEGSDSSIQKITPDGTRTTFSSGVISANSFKIDDFGNIFFIDTVYEFDMGQIKTMTQNIKKIAPDGTITTIASGQINGFTIDNYGNVYYTLDLLDYRTIQKVTPEGLDTTYTMGNFMVNNLTTDNVGNIYFFDYSTYPQNITKVNPDGSLLTYLAADNLYLEYAESLYSDSTVELYYFIYNTSIRSHQLIAVSPIVNTWTGANSTTWNDSGNWDTNSVPTSSYDVNIPATTNQPLLASNVTIHSLTIDFGATLIVPSGLNLTVSNAITNSGTLTVENNANLIQVDNVINTGNTIVKRNSSLLLRSDYTLWSSPVANQNLLTFSPDTVPTRFYDYDSAFGTYGAYSTITSLSTTNFAVGKGYLIRTPNNANATTATVYSGVFTGVLNNGDFPVTLNYDNANANHSYNLVGNPYPSVMDATKFINSNTADIESTLYFWRKTNGALGSAYASYNPAGGVASETSEVPNGKIQVSQGFFVQAKTAGLKASFFTNAMRDLSPTSKQFYKIKQTVEKNRVWINLTNSVGVFSQTLIAYLTDASLGIDRYDGKYINDSPIALTSNINNEEYTIQGRPTFDLSDVVALNFKTDLAGDYTITLDHSDGIFELGQDVYLVDAKTGSETNLKTDAYTFAAATGTDNNRFSLKYQKNLKVDALTFNENTVTVYKNKGDLFVKSKVNAINGIKVFDLNGRLIAEQKNVNANMATIKKLKANDQVLIVQITSDENKVVSKKVIH